MQENINTPGHLDGCPFSKWSDFAIGEQVKWSRALHVEHRGIAAIVVGFVKRRNVVNVKLDTGKVLEACPSRLDKIQG